MAMYLPGFFCALLVITKVAFVIDSARSLADPLVRLEVVHNAMSAMFLSVFIVIIGVRLPVKTRVASVWGIVAALAGSFSLIAVTLSPLTTTSVDLLQIAVGLVVVGMVWTIASILVLGKCFGILPEVRGLVTRGPYRIVRHPIYLGETVAGLGLLLPVLSTWSVLAFCAYVALQIWRTHYEEAALRATFPEYKDYSAHTWRLLPGIV
jgi:protein-S-isoprenylcysteine O-methyltransferase Ste14